VLAILAMLVRQGALVELLAACVAAEPSVSLRSPFLPIRHSCRSAHQAPHSRPLPVRMPTILPADVTGQKNTAWPEP
jgi:hypothetical protein